MQLLTSLPLYFKSFDWSVKGGKPIGRYEVFRKVINYFECFCSKSTARYTSCKLTIHISLANNPLTNKKHIVHCFMKIECCTTSCKNKQTYFSEEKNSKPVKHQNVSVLVPRLGSCVLSPSPSVVLPCFSVIMSVCLSSLCAKANKTNGQRKIPQIDQHFQCVEVLQKCYSVYLYNCPLRYPTI